MQPAHQHESIKHDNAKLDRPLWLWIPQEPAYRCPICSLILSTSVRVRNLGRHGRERLLRKDGNTFSPSCHSRKPVVLSPLVHIPTAATCHTWHSATAARLPSPYAPGQTWLTFHGFRCLLFDTMSSLLGTYAATVLTGPISGCPCGRISPGPFGICFLLGLSTVDRALGLPYQWRSSALTSLTWSGQAGGHILFPAFFSLCLSANPGPKQ